MKKTLNYLIAAGTFAAALFVFDSCSKKDDSLPAIGGFNAASDIEPASLAAYWSFDGNFNESKQSLTPTPSAAAAPTFVTGVKGQAYQGGGDSYVSYPVGSLASLKSMTLSAWVKPAGLPVGDNGTYEAGKGVQGVFHLYNADGSFYVTEIEMEGFHPKTSADSLQFNVGFQSDNSGQYGPHEGVVPSVFLQNSIGKWTHLVMTYDGATSTYTVYQNGAVIGANSAWSSAKTPGPVVILNGETGKGSPLGDLSLSSPIGLIIGAFPQRLNLTADNLGSTSWAGNWQGGIDEFRVYSKALTQAEVGALYGLELAGR